MKKYLLLFIMMMCCFCVFANEWRQCRNCGKNFQGNFNIGYDYCRKNSCQAIRHKEESQKAKDQLASELKYLKGVSDKKQLITRLGKYLANAKKMNAPVKIQMQVIASVYEKLNFSPYTWQQVICYASMDVIKACWPSPDDETVFKKSSVAEANTLPPQIMFSFDKVITIKEPSLYAIDQFPLQDNSRFSGDMHFQSNKKIGCAFALGRHQKTGAIRYVERLNGNSFQYLIWAAEGGRTDVLEWFFKQMGGTDNIVLCVLNGFFAKTLKEYDLEKDAWELDIKNLEKEKSNAADKYQEKEISKKIASLKAKIAEIPTQPVDEYDNVKKIVSKYTDDKTFNEFTLFADKFLATNKRNESAKQYKNIVADFIKSDSKGKQAGEIYATLGVFTWKENLPNLKKTGVLSGKKINQWIAAPGFVMQKDGSAKWRAGLKHPKFPGVVSTKQIFSWMPDSEHLWKNPQSKDLIVIADYQTLSAGTKKAVQISAGVAAAALR